MSLGESISVANFKLVLDFEDNTAAYGTVKATPLGKRIAYDSESVVATTALEQSLAMTGTRGLTAKVPGNHDVGGQLVLDQTFELLPFFLRWAWGSLSTGAPVSTVYPHTAKIGESLPVAVLEKEIPYPAGSEFFLYDGLRVDTWSLKINASGFLKLTLALKGGKRVIGAVAYDAAPTDYRLPAVAHKLHHQMIPGGEAKIDGTATLQILELELSGANNLVADDFAVSGLGYRAGLTPDYAKVNVRGTFRNTDIAIVNLLNDGDDHALAVKYVDGASRDALFTLGAVQFDGTDPSAAQRGDSRLQFTGEAHMDGSGDTITALIHNAIAGAEYATS